MKHMSRLTCSLINKNILKISKKVGKKQAKHKRQLVHRKRNTKSFQT